VNKVRNFEQRKKQKGNSRKGKKETAEKKKQKNLLDLGPQPRSCLGRAAGVRRGAD
jgi:hypothetical protein